MANLIVSYGFSHSSMIGHRSDATVPLLKGSGFRTEVITIGDTSSVGTLVSQSENVVALYAEADCWIQIGKEAPSATAVLVGTTGSSFFLKAERDYQFIVEHGDHISVVQA